MALLLLPQQRLTAAELAQGSLHLSVEEAVAEEEEEEGGRRKEEEGVEGEEEEEGGGVQAEPVNTRRNHQELIGTSIQTKHSTSDEARAACSRNLSNRNGQLQSIDCLFGLEPVKTAM